MPRSAAVLRDLDAPAGLHAAYTMTHRLPDDIANKFTKGKHQLIQERRQCEALAGDLTRLQHERSKTDRQLNRLCDTEDKVAAATHAAEEEVDALDAEAVQQNEELSILRAEKQQLQRKIQAATLEKDQLATAASALGHDNGDLLKAAAQLAGKIERINAERLKFMADCEQYEAEATASETALERLQVQLMGATQLAYSSVIAGNNHQR